jgi:hypothetical protein
MDNSPSLLAIGQIEKCLKLLTEDPQAAPAITYSRVGCGEGFMGSLWRGSINVSETSETISSVIQIAMNSRTCNRNSHSFIAKTVPAFAGERSLQYSDPSVGYTHLSNDNSVHLLSC